MLQRQDGARLHYPAPLLSAVLNVALVVGRAEFPADAQPGPAAATDENSGRPKQAGLLPPPPSTYARLCDGGARRSPDSSADNDDDLEVRDISNRMVDVCPHWTR